jgi:hypothetical protein
MTATRALLAWCLVAAACKRHELPADREAPAVGADLADFDAHAPFAAVSSTRRALVTRHDSQITVWSRAGTKLGELTALAAGSPGNWLAVSATGTLLAEVAERAVRVLDVASGVERWKIDLDDPVWGSPEFSPDGRTLAVPMQGKIALLDTATGKERGKIDNDAFDERYPLGAGLSQVREIWFSSDGTRLAARCGTDEEWFANHALFVADTKTEHLVAAVLDHVDSIGDAVWLPDGRVVTIDQHDTVRAIRDGHVEGTLEFDADRGGMLAASDDLSTIAVGNHVLTVWRAGHAPVNIARRDDKAMITGLELHGDQVVELTYAGTIHTYAIPATAADPKAAWTKPDPAVQAREAALFAIATTKTVPEANGDPAVAAMRQLVDRQQNGERPYRGAVDLDAIEILLKNGFVDEAHAMLDGWFVHPRRGEDARVKALGLRLAVVDSGSEEGPIAQSLYARWPDDPEVVRVYATQMADIEPERVQAAVVKALAKRPHDVELWKIRIGAADEKQAKRVYELARRVLTPDELAQLEPFVAGSDQ